MFITLVSFFAVTNVRDKILTDCTRSFIEQLGHQCQILDIQGRCIINESENENDRLAKIELSKERNSNKKLLEDYYTNTLKHSNAVIFAGGAILDVISKDIAEKVWQITNIANQMKIPVAFNAAGFFGNKFDTPNGDFIKKALHLPNVIWISIRERTDDIKRLLNNDKQFYNCCDTAVWASEIYSVKRNASSKIIGINIINNKAYKYNSTYNILNLEELYWEIYCKIESAGYSCNFFTNGVNRDYEYAQSILDKYGINQNKLINLKESKEGKSFVKMISQFALIISSRLHTSICAYSLRIPSLCIPWDDKMVSFYKSIKREKWLLNTQNVNELEELIKGAINENLDDNEYDSYRKSVKNNIKNLCNKLKTGIL